MATNLRVFALNKEKKIIILDQNQTFENNKDIIKKRFGLENLFDVIIDNMEYFKADNVLEIFTNSPQDLSKNIDPSLENTNDNHNNNISVSVESIDHDNKKEDILKSSFIEEVLTKKFENREELRKEVKKIVAAEEFQVFLPDGEKQLINGTKKTTFLCKGDDNSKINQKNNVNFL